MKIRPLEGKPISFRQSVPEPNAAITEADRDRIRDFLLAYCENKGPGAPALRNLIAQANGIEPHLFPLSTLQRFLAAKHRTSDNYVRMCAVFVQQEMEDAATSELQANPVPYIGESLTTFLRSSDDDPALTTVPENRTGSFSGTAPRQSASAQFDPDAEPVTYSRLTISPESQPAYARVYEHVFNPKCIAGLPDLPDSPQHTYEGVAVTVGAAIFILMKNALAGTPRTYWLSIPEDDEPLSGHACEPTPSVAYPSQDPVTPIPVKFDRAETGAAP